MISGRLGLGLGLGLLLSAAWSSGISGSQAGEPLYLRIIKRVSPPDDAAALLHVEDVRGTLQQMGLFQTFT